MDLVFCSTYSLILSIMFANVRLAITSIAAVKYPLGLMSRITHVAIIVSGI